MLQDRLYDKVAELIVDKDLYAFKRDSDQIFLPLPLGSRDAILDHLATVLVPGDLREMLDHWIIND